MLFLFVLFVLLVLLVLLVFFVLLLLFLFLVLLSFLVWRRFLFRFPLRRLLVGLVGTRNGRRITRGLIL